MRGAAVAIAALATALLSGPSAADDEKNEYAISVSGPESIAVGAEGVLELTVAPAAGRSISSEGPVRLAVSVAPAKGLDLPRRRFDRRHARDGKAPTLRFDVAALGSSPGTYELALDIRFWICAKRTCRPVRESRALEVAVEQAAPPADAGPQ